MASNLIKLTRRHHPVDAPTALAKLSEIVAETGTLTDDDIRTVATDYQLPEASVYGIATFYDDLIAPRGRSPRPRREKRSQCASESGTMAFRTNRSSLVL